MILDFEESLIYIRGNFHELYPPVESRTKTIAHIPERLHGDLIKLAKDRGLKVYEVLAGLVDFLNEYEDLYKKELKAQRKTKKR